MPLRSRPLVILGEHSRPGGPPELDGFVLTSFDNYTLARFRIDTGADRTVIGPGVREALGYDADSLPVVGRPFYMADGSPVQMRELTVSLSFRTLDGGLAFSVLPVLVPPEPVSDYETPSLLGIDFLYLLNLTVAPTHSQLEGLAPYDPQSNTYDLDQRVVS